MIFTNSPDYFVTKTLCETRLIVNSAAIVCEIGYEEFCLSNCGNNFIINSVVVFLAINAQSFVPGSAHTRFESINEKVVKIVSKGHGYERLCAFGLRTF